jgi:hypothetical protein
MITCLICERDFYNENTNLIINYAPRGVVLTDATRGTLHTVPGQCFICSEGCNVRMCEAPAYFMSHKRLMTVMLNAWSRDYDEKVDTPEAIREPGYTMYQLRADRELWSTWVEIMDEAVATVVQDTLAENPQIREDFEAGDDYNDDHDRDYDDDEVYEVEDMVEDAVRGEWRYWKELVKEILLLLEDL